MPTRPAFARARLTIAAFAILASGATACLGHDLNTPRPSRMTVLSGDWQTVAPNARSANPLVVQVSDQFGRLIEGETVTWTVRGGGGTAETPVTTTDATGIAQTFYTAGATEGLVDISATLDGLGTITFTVRVAAASGP